MEWWSGWSLLLSFAAIAEAAVEAGVAAFVAGVACNFLFQRWHCHHHLFNAATCDNNIIAARVCFVVQLLFLFVANYLNVYFRRNGQIREHWHHLKSRCASRVLIIICARESSVLSTELEALNELLLFQWKTPLND